MSGALRILGFALDDPVASTRLDEFRRIEPRVELLVDELPPDHDALLAEIAAGAAPDVLYLDREMLGAYVARNAILPVDDWLSRDEIDLHQYRSGPLRHVTVGGRVQAIPEWHDIQVLFVHPPSLMAQYVLPADLEFGDWLRLPRLNRDLTEVSPDGTGVIGFETGLPELLPIWAKANGADLLSADGRTATFDDPRVIEALEVAKGMIDDQGGWSALRAYWDRVDLFGAGNPLARGRVGVLPMEASYLEVLAEVTPGLDVLVKPIVDRHALPLSFSRGMAWAVPRGAADPERSWRFIRTVSSPDAWTAGARARLAASRETKRPFAAMYTANKVADARIWTEVYEPSGLEPLDRAHQAIRMIQETGYSVPQSRAPREVRAAWIAGTRRALRGDRRIAQAMRDANLVAQRALDAAG